VTDAAVEDVEAPARVPRGLPFEVRATVRSTGGEAAAVFLLKDGVSVERRDLRLARGETRVHFTTTAEATGEHRYGVRVAQAGDGEPRNDVAETAVLASGRPRILWIGADRLAPRDTGMDVISAEPAALAEPLRHLEAFEAVVLADVEVDALPPGLPERLQRYVGEQGGGLLMLGGAHSFGPGGYRATAIEEALPVDLDPGSRRRRPGLGLVVALDKSGSMAEAMSGVPKIAAAREAVLAAAALLEPGDRFGLLVFDGAPARALPLQEAPGRGRLQAVLAGLRPGGGTRILPAIAEAAAMLEHLPGWRRHVVLVTDGQGEGGDFPGAGRALAARGITLSTVAVGDDADLTLLRELAAAGGGRTERTRDAARLATALRREVTLARGPLIHEGRMGVVGSPHPILGETADRPIPPLRGYVATAPKPFAAVPLRAESGDPILALGSFGLGRSAALTTDPAGPWGAEWQRWPAWPPLLARTLGWLLRAPEAGGVAIRQEPARGGGWALAVEAVDGEGNHLNGRALWAHLRGEGGGALAVPLEQRGPGTYAGPLPARVSAPTLVVLEDRSPDGGRAVAQGRIGLSYPEEYRLRGPDLGLLEEVRRVAHGTALAPPGVVPVLVLRSTQPRVIPLGGMLATLALGLFLLDVAIAGGLAIRPPWRTGRHPVPASSPRAPAGRS
jgi:Mg-chelatase subunit ChlD